MAKKEKTLKVTWIRQAKMIEALGFKKLGQTRVLPDNDSIRGSLHHVAHLVKVEEE